MDFIKRNFAFIAVVLGTLILLIGGVFIFSRGGTTTKTVSSDLLIGKDSYQTDPQAAVTLVEFGDYQCPACGDYHLLVKQLLVEFNGKINFVFRNFPLSQHTNANISSYAVEAAGFQGKYWEMHNKVYETQSEWSGSSDAKSIFVGYAQGLGLNVDKFKTDIDLQSIKDKVKKDYDDGIAVGITATPTFYLNGTKVGAITSYDVFKKFVQEAIDKASASK